MFFPLHRTIAPRGLKLIMKVRPNAFQLAVIFYLGRKKKKKIKYQTLSPLPFSYIFAVSISYCYNMEHGMNCFLISFSSQH